MPPFASEQFHAITSAKPECIWDALTTTGVPLDYLHGMTVDTDWQPGARVTLALADQWRLTGEVLAAEQPHRLSYTLDDPPGSPSVYVTWELRRTSDGTIIRLNVDEPWPLAGSTEDLESAWLPVLSGLVKHLERGPASPSEKTGTGRRAAASQGPAPAGTRDTPADRPDARRPQRAHQPRTRRVRRSPAGMTTTRSISAPAKGTVMDFVSVRVITHDVERLATFWEKVTGLPATRPVPVFAELRTPAGTIAVGAPATVGMLGAAAPVPGQNRSVFIELRVEDIDATWEQVKGLVPQTVPEIVLEPTDMPWGNRSVILRDPDGGLVNLFTPITPEAKAKYGL